jgi:DNA-binding transcriptional LysR family regulator
MLDPVKLATLRAVVEHRSFSAAGEALALTQPAVSRQVSALEQRLGTPLVRRSRTGVHPTEAGRVLVAHAEAVLARLALAEAQIAELRGLRRGRVRLGSFFTALVHLSSELGALLEEREPGLFHAGTEVIEDELVDRATALRRLAAGELDLALVFEHAFEPEPAPPEVELVPLFDDPACALLPAAHPLAGAAAVEAADLAGDPWIQAHAGSAARLVDHVLAAAGGLGPPRLRAGHGDEPVEAQAFVAAGRGVTVAHRLNIVLDPARVAVVALRGGPVRHVQAAVMRGQGAPATLAALDALREVGRRRASG